MPAGYGIEYSRTRPGTPSEEVAAAAMGPRVRRGSVQMEAMGLWRPSMDMVLIP